MSKQYDKPFKTFDELVNLLEQEHGLDVPDHDVAKQVLQFIPYYDLVNGYKDILMTQDKYTVATTISDLYLFHTFDRDFQKALFDLSVMIEDYFKNILAYTIAGSFGVDEADYLLFSNYLVKRGTAGKHSVRRDIVLPTLRNIANTSYDNPTLYYRNNHNHIPPWILLKNTTFSLSTNLFVLLKRPQKQEILDFMLPVNRAWNQRFPVLLYILTMVRKCRNTIAHNLKFTSFNCGRYMNNLDRQSLRELIPVSLLSDAELNRWSYLDGIYGYIILCISMIPNNLSKAMMINSLLNAIEINPLLSGEFQGTGDVIRQKYFSGTDIPLDIKDRLLLYLQELLPQKP